MSDCKCPHIPKIYYVDIRVQACMTQTVTELTSCWNEVSIWDEEFVAIMFLQDIREDLQGKAFLFPGLLTPLVRVHFGVGQVRIVVFVF